jgi:hypothetical protein
VQIIVRILNAIILYIYIVASYRVLVIYIYIYIYIYMELMNVEPADSTIKQDRMVYIERMTNWDTATQA